MVTATAVRRLRTAGGIAGRSCDPEPMEVDLESKSTTEASGSRGSREGNRRCEGHRDGREPRDGRRRHDAAPREGTGFGRVFPGGEKHPGAPRGRRYAVRR